MTERPELVRLMPEVAKHLLGEPNAALSKPGELRFGSHGSLCVDTDKGTFYDHEANEGGGVLDLVRRERGLANGQAVQFLKDEGILPREPEKRQSRIVASYDYHDASGAVLFQVVRREPKKFIQRQPDGRGGWSWSVKGVQVVPYRLPDIVKAIASGRTVFVVEGEKDADALSRLGLTATCNAGGSGKWRSQHAAALKGAKRVAILPDNDDAGGKHGQSVAASLAGLVDDVRIVALPDLPVKGDVSDWLASGSTVDELKALVERADVYTAQAPERLEDWQAGLIFKENDIPYQNIGNVLHVIRKHPEWQGVYGYDEHAARRVLLRSIPGTNDTTTPRDFRDADAANGAAWFNANGFPGIGAARVHEALAAVAMERPFHPVRDYLTSLSWDGIARLDTWLMRLGGVVVTDATRAYVSAVGAKTLIAAVARIMKPGCKVDTVLILEGPQGAMKSTALRVLAGEEHFGDALPDMGGKDARDYLRGKFIIEIAELATMNKSEVEQVKAFITRQEERFRPAYGREEVSYPRQCIFAGTTNKSEFLRDETGNRRFWPVTVEGFDIAALKSERNQLWAEALHRYRAGEEWWLAGDLERTAEREQAGRVVGDEWSEPIAEYLSELKEGHETTIRTVANEALHIMAADLTPQAQNRIRAAMLGLGWAKLRREPKTGRALYGRKGAA